MKNVFGNLILLCVSLSIMFVIGEVASRYVSPISPGPSILDMQGNKQRISYVSPNKQFRIITPDYDAVTNITPDGYRAPASKGNPEVVFIGDSFTYAQGVKDHEAFPAIYCNAKNLNCANLSVPGSSTLYEVDRLESYIKDKGWRPQKVNFFFFTGNDFGDNLIADELRSQGQGYEPGELNLNPDAENNKGTVEKIIDFGLKHSNLLRVAYYKVLPIIRNDPEEAEAQLNKSLNIAGGEFKRLDQLSKAYGFEYEVFVIFPEPEIIHNKYQELGKKLQAISPKPLVILGDVFKNNTKDYFFPSDGHFNVEGNKKLAEYLIAR
ncbi:SGNH/GDSL hydrolase family protein [Cocleimonas sp. KMM 6892]|uniref:SGNH/GDSL hydrolase family protein n=1 Tax=unclassified Cocleimonas TaxID=2639732 RepID=UPI002DB5F8B2|nr:MULTISPECIES: SGNH/GDSL hydrolase family protein [unclassified Cocleimonas]MEB8431500.1 SGNH/GDSL hydrolase family protein [Cocleimonas sp. KMM 6892]MEC4713728.1 SGNH/GDSL hydrolase family protein [Cocleimonas sp. KMM 6895]MEC4743059.1 SGNH/GDSL hydrolase family protein [Cocleimonas sp. KMM 6896]